jgi:DNA-binding CsgD family transcriptional regulator
MTELSAGLLVPSGAARALRCDWDSAISDSSAPASLWQAMLCGQLRIRDQCFDDQWMALSLVGAKTVSLDQRRLTILSQGFAARAQKVISIEQGVAPSTVTGVIRQALTRLGLECIPSRLPLVVSIAAGAGLAGALVPGARCVKQVLDGDTHIELLLQDPGGWLGQRLSASEAVVARLRLHGASLEMIARRRQRSVRTVANQLGSAYRKLGVGSRGELIVQLTAAYLNGSVPIPGSLRRRRISSVQARASTRDPANETTLASSAY